MSEEETQTRSQPVATTQPLSERLLAAHVAFVKQQLTDAQLLSRIETEVDRILDWLETVPFDRVVHKEDLLQTLEECVINYPFEKEEAVASRLALMGGVLRALVYAESHQGVSIREVVSEESFVKGVDKAVDMDKLRDDIVDAVLTSSVYADLVSDVLYNGIKGFILEENLLAKLPGVSSLLKMGKWGMSRTLPNLDQFVESAAKTFIAGNIPKTVSLSKRTLNASLSGDNIRRLADEFWGKIATEELSFGKAYVDEGDIADFSQLTESAWLHYRKTDHFRSICGEFIDRWLAEYGEVTVGELFKRMGGDRGLMSRQIEKYVRRWVGYADEDGVLDKMIEAQLAPFYGSAEFLGVVEGC